VAARRTSLEIKSAISLMSPFFYYKLNNKSIACSFEKLMLILIYPKGGSWMYWVITVLSVFMWVSGASIIAYAILVRKEKQPGALLIALVGVGVIFAGVYVSKMSPASLERVGLFYLYGLLALHSLCFLINYGVLKGGQNGNPCANKPHKRWQVSRSWTLRA
jgi:hypothetical protein